MKIETFKLSGCPTKYRGDQVAGVCAAGGMRALSLDDSALANELVISKKCFCFFIIVETFRVCFKSISTNRIDFIF
jgi:hypothetical protein